jgi:hypothetical protein
MTDQPATRPQATYRDAEVALGAVLDRAGWSGAGVLFIVLAAPAFLPVPLLPTGVVAGSALALLAVQLLAGWRRPWLPGRLRRIRLSRARLAPGVVRVVGLLGRLGLAPKPRMAWALRGPLARTLAALSLLVAALVLVLPVPLGNQLPALAAAAFGLALLRRDGLAALAGHGLTLLAAGWTVALVATGGALLAQL